jgi:hypothetical protein
MEMSTAEMLADLMKRGADHPVELKLPMREARALRARLYKLRNRAIEVDPAIRDQLDFEIAVFKAEGMIEDGNDGLFRIQPVAYHLRKLLQQDQRNDDLAHEQIGKPILNTNSSSMDDLIKNLVGE